MRVLWPGTDNENAWACCGDPSAIDLVIFRLRRKLGDSAGDPTYLETRRGFGYILHHACIVEARARVIEEDTRRQQGPAASTQNTPIGGPRDLWTQLTRREWEIFLLLGDEEATRLTTKALAQQLGIAESTMKKHLQNIYRKLGVENRSGAALLAMQARIL